MRRPLRRAGGSRQPAAATPDPADDRTRTRTRRADRLAPSAPTTEWARVAPLHATAAPKPPLTFQGDRFGRSVAGARTVAASMRHKPADPGRAPSGVLLDAARIESIAPVERHTTPEVPAVPAVLPATPPVHRKPVAERPAPHDLPQDLMSADADVAFAPAPERNRPLTMMSWSAAAGFATPAEAAEAAEAADVAAAAEPGAPTLRFVPAPGPRRERPPRDLVDLVAGVTGVDVGDTVIDRSPEVSDRARAIGAIAFTERATVHLPSELGDLHDPVTRAVVAHELTHVAQQRTVGTPPSESSPEGRVFEAQAQTVQRSVAHGVRPHFMRARVGSLDSAAGVQRLADDDPYAWQQRDEAPSDDRALEMLGLSGHFGIAERNPRDRDEAWAQSFEERHARTLQHRRNERYQELRDETLRDKRTALLREDDESEPELDRDDLLALREWIDDEMPFEFGPPEGIDPYPETLPPAEAGDDDRRPGWRGSARTRRTGGTTFSTSGGRRLRASTGYGAGSSLGSRRTAHGRGPGGMRRPGAGGEHGDDEFEWQHREPTDQGAITALFGGGLFGSLLALATGPETDADRAAAEAATPRLHEQRQERERELRHVTLREKLTEAHREETASSERPIVLSRDEIVGIRAQVDEAMPLQFVTPEYVDMLEDAQITIDGQIARAERLAEEDDDEPAGRTAGRPGERATTATTTSPPGGATADHDAARHDDHDADTYPPDRDEQAGHGLPGRFGTALASVGAAAFAGRVADRLDRDGQRDQAAHDDEHGLDQETAGRIFASASDLDIDVLSRRIWHRIRREMRSELIVDRERAGSLADIR